jgi:bifunctional UDP-N-acetylglucosamine pyrophosphorylase / glucosamine-1-phosphate N-acetyltransferase
VSAVHVVVLAAGKGTRMKSDLAKVLHRAAGRTLLDWVLDSVDQVNPARTVVVVGHQAEVVSASLSPRCESVLQEPQNGTGHAVQVALDHLGVLDADDTVLIAYGDMPLVEDGLYRSLAQRPAGTAVRMVTVDPGPPGFGRILRDGDGTVTGIVEERDCTPEQATITERNAGIYAFGAGDLANAIAHLDTDNAQGELYLTDVIAGLAVEGKRIETVVAAEVEVTGVNSHSDLAGVQAILRSRINEELMAEGVWMLDPARTYVDATVTVAGGAMLYPGVHLEGDTVVEEGARVGPDTRVIDSRIGPEAVVTYSVVRESEIGRGASVGPFASLRPGSVLHPGAKAGTFVETKKTEIGEGAKVPHLAYMGDAVIGAGANVGAGSITCNYDGYEKHQTVIGEGAFIGSDTMLVAPVNVGKGAVTGAGSVITADVEPGALAVERSPQKEVPGYAERRAARQRAKDAEQGN